MGGASGFVSQVSNTQPATTSATHVLGPSIASLNRTIVLSPLTANSKLRPTWRGWAASGGGASAGGRASGNAASAPPPPLPHAAAQAVARITARFAHRTVIERITRVRSAEVGPFVK
jgi:hypothetical protein